MYMFPFNLQKNIAGVFLCTLYVKRPVQCYYEKLLANSCTPEITALLLLLQVSIPHSDECLWLVLGESKVINSCVALDPQQTDVSGVCYRSC